MYTNQTNIRQQTTSQVIGYEEIRFIFDLKICNVGAVILWIGNMFQSLGEAMAKAKSPLDFNFDFGTVNKLWLADLRVLSR